MFSDELVKYRLEHGLTQLALASELEVPLRTVQAWEQGYRVPPAYVQRLILLYFRAET